MLRFSLLFGGAALLAFLLWQLGPSEVLGAFRRIGWYFIPVLLLGGAHHATRALALRACVPRSALLPFSDALGIRLSGEAVESLTFTGPVLSEPTKAWLLEDHGLSLQEGFAATVTEYLIYSFVTVAMSVSGLLYLVSRFAPLVSVRTLAIVIVCLFSAFLVASSVAIARRF